MFFKKFLDFYLHWYRLPKNKKRAVLLPLVYLLEQRPLLLRNLHRFVKLGELVAIEVVGQLVPTFKAIVIYPEVFDLEDSLDLGYIL